VLVPIYICILIGAFIFIAKVASGFIEYGQLIECEQTCMLWLFGLSKIQGESTIKDNPN